MFYSTLKPYFSSYNSHFSKSLLDFCEGMFFSCSSNSWEVARKVSSITNSNFKSSEMRRYRLLSNNKFVVNDSLFRSNINILYDYLEQNNFIQNGDNLLIAVDFTTKCNKYLILTASIIIGEESYPIYFSLRNYPNKKGRYDHKKMEEAFIKGLKHILSKRYSYTITADRGFGNDRFIELCENNDFNYLIRIMPNMKGEYEEELGIIRNLFKEPCKKNILVKKWGKTIDFYMVSDGKNEWFIASNIANMSHDECGKIYKKRFKIEKIFQNMKSSGFDLESSKINQYSKFKRLLFCCFLSYNILIMLGKHINDKMKNLKKNSSVCESLILAFLTLQENQLPISTSELDK